MEYLLSQQVKNQTQQTNFNHSHPNHTFTRADRQYIQFLDQQQSIQLVRYNPKHNN